MIILSQTYEIVTQESAECGEADERGFDWENIPHGFRETVELIRDGGFLNASCSHGVPRWLSTEGEQDMITGDYEIKSLHPANDKRTLRYWAKACKVAGIDNL